MDSCDAAEKKAPAKVRFIQGRQVELAVDALIAILKAKDVTLFSHPFFDKVSAMIQGLFNLTPPTRTDLKSETQFVNDRVNFRDVLLAGWLAWHSPKRSGGLKFSPINRLCDRAILFDRAVSLWNEYPR